MTTSDASAIKRGQRLKQLRQLAKLKRDELAHLAKVSKASISYWENASLSELSQSGAEKVVRAIQEKKGIDCSVEWLLFGIGMQPRIKNLSSQNNLGNTVNTLNQEIDLFLSNAGTVMFQITSSTMRPVFEIGDIVGGLWTTPEICINKELICIVEFNNQLQARKVKQGETEGKYDLSYLSFTDQLNEPFEIKNIELKAVAPVIRVWKLSC